MAFLYTGSPSKEPAIESHQGLLDWISSSLFFRAATSSSRAEIRELRLEERMVSFKDLVNCHCSVSDRVQAEQYIRVIA